VTTSRENLAASLGKLYAKTCAVDGVLLSKRGVCGDCGLDVAARRREAERRATKQKREVEEPDEPPMSAGEQKFWARLERQRNERAAGTATKPTTETHSRADIIRANPQKFLRH